MDSFTLEEPYTKSAVGIAAHLSVKSIRVLKVERVTENKVPSLKGALWFLRNYFANDAVIHISSSNIVAFSKSIHAELESASGVKVIAHWVSAYEQTDPVMTNILNGIPNRPPPTAAERKESEKNAARIRELL